MIIHEIINSKMFDIEVILDFYDKVIAYRKSVFNK
jgi:hypothetical protein